MKGFWPARINVSEGAISILFYMLRQVPHQAAVFVPRILLLDAASGRVTGNYIFDESTTGKVLCFNRDDGYTLMAMDGVRAAMQMVPLR